VLSRLLVDISLGLVGVLVELVADSITGSRGSGSVDLVSLCR
jgi:hypothetical protein